MKIGPLQLTRPEIEELYRIESHRQRRSKWAVAPPYLVIAVGFLIFVDGNFPAAIAPVLLMIVGLYMLITPIMQGYRGMEQWVQKLASTPWIEYEFDPQSIRFRTAHASGSRQREGFGRIVESRQLVLFYTDANQFIYAIPKRAFQNLDQLDQARAIFGLSIPRREVIGFPVVQSKPPKDS